MSKNWGVVEALRHARHDWMNDLQLIKGNLDLDRVERAKQVIEEMVLVAQNESKLSNLRLPLLAEWILTYNWSRHLIKLDFEVLQSESAHGLEDRRLYDWCKEFLEFLESNVMNNVENQLSILLDITKEHSRFIFDFTGILKSTCVVKDWIKNQRSNGENIEIEQLQEEVLVIHVVAR
ncbi:Spo0B C-terminal domain-containing protein [Rossellomorea arthrocnemi]|jgi:stage 0 sporulation protein B (sporulation initiation phosphotransferase)|uniref:Spo0B C-terminal domain-containing protein n=1 Tax=Rossellomorea arthrocnemi TaxID=2769542 RepID=UPI0019191C83|nr:Spo0B C-terminal domain-containing protein [Rossellomorea arthrocnemi]